MTLEELKAADQETKDNIALSMYKTLIRLYYDQNGYDAELPTIYKTNEDGSKKILYSSESNLAN